MGMRVRYNVIAEKTLWDFCDSCEKALNDNWNLAGGVVIREKEFLQTITRIEEETPLPIPTKKKRGRPKGSVKKSVSKGKAVKAKSKTP
jgi:hypothetical protein